MPNTSKAGTLGRFIRTFYDVRRTASRTGRLCLLEPFLAPDVRWSEPDVGAHMGHLRGREAVIDMIRRAIHKTAGSFELTVTGTVETATHVSATIDWSAVADCRQIQGSELATYEVREGCIVAAWFHPENIADDHTFWGEQQPTIR